jgi:hypothetical protein
VDERFTHLTRGRRFNAALMSMFGLVAIAIGALGVYYRVVGDAPPGTRVLAHEPWQWASHVRPPNTVMEPTARTCRWRRSS